LGWEPREWLESGLQKTVEWYLTNESWIASIQEQREYQQWLDNNYQKRGETE
jgi:dTDP-glucose 4,6-dehydratase